MPNDTDDKKLFGKMFKSMIDRDPKKRKVKPNSKNYGMLNLDFFGETSSEDEDYQPKDLPEEDDENISESDENIDNADSDSNDEEKSKDSDDSSENESEPEEKFKINDYSSLYSIAGTTSTEKKTSITFKINNSSSSKNSLNSLSLLKPKQEHTDIKFKKLFICSICLSDESLEIDEIVECDCCSITVHESCYGLINPNEEVESLDSDASSNTTEPWFCDACKANNSIVDLNCELCPIQGGIFKQTETGRWVHLVCALYINGVAFSNTQQLSGITLFEMNYERWGLRTCVLCEDERFARTGVCISCDAGMCRNYFHVTCAQAHGLLCDAQNSDETEVVDPFYAHCKQHALEKHVVKVKKRNYLALQLRLKQIRSSDNKMDERILCKLEEAREIYKQSFESNLERKNILQNLNYKAPRPLISSSNVMKKLIAKSEMLGMSPQAHIISSQDVMDMRKKWHIPVAFSVEFVGYYLDRNIRVKSMQKKLEELNKQNNQLRNQEELIIKSYEDRNKLHETINKTFDENLNSLTNLYQSLNILTNTKISLPPKIKSIINDKPHKIPNGITKTFNNQNNNQNDKRLLKCCGLCRRSNDQHALALCDNCKLFYHFQCLDPPLTRMPRKTKFGGWQCSECTTKEEEEEEELSQMPIDVNEKRKLRLRENVKGPEKFIPEDHTFSFNYKDLRRTKKRKRSSIKTTSSNSSTSSINNKLILNTIKKEKTI